MALWGSWIWDCGHFTTGSKVTGERTELHPLNGIVVNRRSSYRAKRGEFETNVFISSDGNYAHAEEACALTHHATSKSTYDSGYRACVQKAGNEQQPLKGKYSFFVPAPPKPSPGATLKYRVVRDVKGTAATQKIKVHPTGLAVTVSLKSQPAGKTRSYGRSFFVRWTGTKPAAPTRLKVTFKQVRILKSEPLGSNPHPATSPWNLYLDLNGYWKLLNDWSGKLLAVADGQTVPLDHTVSITVPAGRGVWVLVHGRECDEPAGQIVFGELVPIVHPCPTETKEKVQFGNDDVGIVLDKYKSASAAIGTHTTLSTASTKGFQGSGKITFGDGKIGQHAFELTYVVKRG